MSIKIAILSVADKRHMTMVSSYTELFDRKNIAYDVICIDRYNEIIRDNEDELFVFPYNDNGRRINKLISFLKFKHFAQKIMNKKKYDFIVIWNENTAALFVDYLCKKYKNRYCVNQRDIDFFDKPLIKGLYSHAVVNSSFSTTCIPNMNNIPEGYAYTLLLSKNDKIIRDCKKREGLSAKQPIKLSFIGKIRFHEADTQLINAFANDDRFELQFIGAGSEVYEDYIKKKQIKNISLVGRYKPEETKKYLNDADIINAYYGTEFSYYKYFVPIRFGYAPALNIPILVTKDTLMDEIGSRYGFSFAVDCKESLFELPGKLYYWYRSIDFNHFSEGCSEYCEYIDAINMAFEKKCMDAIYTD